MDAIEGHRGRTLINKSFGRLQFRQHGSSINFEIF